MTELEKKIYNGEHLTERELRVAVFECDEVTTEYGENLRWSRSVRSIIKIEDKLFCIEWEEGLTECQLNCFDDQPYEVEEVEETIVVKRYIPKIISRDSING